MLHNHIKQNGARKNSSAALVYSRALAPAPLAAVQLCDLGLQRGQLLVAGLARAQRVS
jgi:hypothetical protein